MPNSFRPSSNTVSRQRAGTAGRVVWRTVGRFVGFGVGFGVGLAGVGDGDIRSRQSGPGGFSTGLETEGDTSVCVPAGGADWIPVSRIAPDVTVAAAVILFFRPPPSDGPFSLWRATHAPCQIPVPLPNAALPVPLLPPKDARSWLARRRVFSFAAASPRKTSFTTSSAVTAPP